MRYAHPLCIATILFTLSSCTVLTPKPKMEIRGTYLNTDGFAGSKYEFGADGRFRQWSWGDVGGYQPEPSMVGEWRTVSSNVIRLDSDRIPVEAVQAHHDPSIDGYRLSIHFPEAESTGLLEFVSVDIECYEPDPRYPDTPLFLRPRPDSTGVLEWADCTPRQFRVYDWDRFTVERLFEQPTPLDLIRDELGPHRRVGNQDENAWDVTLEERFEFAVGELVFVRDGEIYPLRYGLKRYQDDF